VLGAAVPVLVLVAFLPKDESLVFPLEIIRLKPPCNPDRFFRTFFSIRFPVLFSLLRLNKFMMLSSFLLFLLLFILFVVVVVVKSQKLILLCLFIVV